MSDTGLNHDLSNYELHKMAHYAMYVLGDESTQTPPEYMQTLAEYTLGILQRMEELKLLSHRVTEILNENETRIPIDDEQTASIRRLLEMTNRYCGNLTSQIGP